MHQFHKVCEPYRLQALILKVYAEKKNSRLYSETWDLFGLVLASWNFFSPPVTDIPREKSLGDQEIYLPCYYAANTSVHKLF